jgi:hypothetical protein
MATTQVSSGQCLIDVAIQEYGSIEALFDLAKDNNLEVDDDLIPGQVLQIRDTLPDTADPDLVDYFARKSIRVNSGAVVAITEILATNDDEAITTNDNEGLTL